MSNNYQIKFMTTLGCHLCDQAWSMIEYWRQNREATTGDINIDKVEISDSEELVQQYGVRIPVLVAKKGELGWPFEYQDLVDWLES